MATGSKVLCLLLAWPVLWLGATGSSAAPAPAVAAALPENLALKAKATASSEFGDQYLAKFAIDGKIPAPSSGDDLSRAWAVQGTAYGGKGEFTLQWAEPVKVAELVYYGRTAWQMAECLKDYEVWLDGASEPAAKGQFKMAAGPQRIRLAQPREARKLALKFLSTYGGSNPGASEIQVFSEGPSDKALAAFFKAQTGGAAGEPLAESEELARQVEAGQLGFDQLLLIKRHRLDPSHVYTNHCEGFRPGGGLYLLSPPKPDGKLTELLKSPEGQILDMDLSWDGREILFSWRKNAQVGYHVFRMNVDGTGLAQLTDGPWHDYYACWLPDGGIAMVSTRTPRGALCWVTSSGVLHRMDRDGGNVRRLSSNYVDDFTPTVLPDGRILYTRWEYVDRPAIPIQSLWTIHPDGTKLEVFYGNRVLSPASFMEAQPVPGTRSVMCTLTSHNGPIRGGIGLVNNLEGLNAQAALDNLTPEVRVGPVDKGDGNNVRGPYERPRPISDKRFLVARDGAIVLGEIGKGLALVYASTDGIGCYNAIPLAPRPRMPALAQRDPGDPESGATSAPAASGDSGSADGEATVYLVDVYRGLEPAVPRGSIKAVRVVEEVPKPLRTDVLGFGFQRPVISCGAAYAVKKVWGTVPVAEDGSAYFKVPTGRPLYFLAINDQGVAVQRMRSFTHFVPGEVQGCIGCHEPRETTPPTGQNLAALRGPARPLDPPSWGVTGFDYARHVQPVLDKHCVRCHGGMDPQGGVDLSGDRTDWFNVSYDVLARRYVNWIDTRNGNEANILQIAPNTWGSPRSKLAALLLAGHPDKEGKARAALDPDGLTRIFTWIDLNVPYYGTYEMEDEHREGGRRVYPAGLTKTLADVWSKRCAECHKGKPAAPEFVRITSPELNPFLAAPLAKSAGGRGACKGEVFRSKEDPDYQVILRTFDPVQEALKARPRMDMDGAVPDAHVKRSTL